MPRTLRPIGDRVVVKPVALDEKVGSLFIPETSQEKPQLGEVLSVGAGLVNEVGARIPLDVEAGSKILYGKFSGTEIELDGQKVLILRQEEILGVVEGEN